MSYNLSLPMWGRGGERAEEYHSFGTSSYRSGRTETEVSFKRYRYVGKERDEEIGLYYYGARYYAAWLGRFVSVDPLQHKYPHYTPYQYAGNKPISYIDLDGMEENKIIENRINFLEKGAKEDFDKAMKENAFKSKIEEIKKSKYKDEPGNVHDVIVNFTTNLEIIKPLINTNQLEKIGGTIASSGINNNGEMVAYVYWDKAQTKALGASGIFEEAYHLADALIGDEMKFAKSTGSQGKWGLANYEISDEIRAKKWVANTITRIDDTYKSSAGFKFTTHYGYIKNNKLNEDGIRSFLTNEVIESRDDRFEKMNQIDAKINYEKRTILGSGGYK